MEDYFDFCVCLLQEQHVSLARFSPDLQQFMHALIEKATTLCFDAAALKENPEIARFLSSWIQENALWSFVTRSLADLEKSVQSVPLRSPRES